MAENRQPTPRKCRCGDNTRKLIIELALPQIELMEPGDECESKHLFERECWDSLTHAEQIGLGQCIVCLVSQGALSLENLGASPRTANHVVYRRI